METEKTLGIQLQVTRPSREAVAGQITLVHSDVGMKTFNWEVRSLGKNEYRLKIAGEETNILLDIKKVRTAPRIELGEQDTAIAEVVGTRIFKVGHTIFKLLKVIDILGDFKLYRNETIRIDTGLLKKLFPGQA